jgi:hypothetical protein
MNEVPAIVELLDARRLLSAGPSDEFLTDGQLEFADSMTVAEVRGFLADWGGYFRVPRVDVDGGTFDLARAVVDAGQLHDINPQVLLTTLQKEHSGITRTTRPTPSQMAYLMGSGQPSTARAQIFDAADRLRDYLSELDSQGFTRSGWRVGVPKATQDGVVVTPANRATAGQFTYTPYAGVVWGGNLSQVGGVELFAKWWGRFGFDDRTGPVARLAFDVDAPIGPAVRVAFDEPVVGLTASDLRWQIDGTIFSGGAASVDVAPDRRSAVFRLPTNLPIGDYTATLPAGTVTDGAANASTVARTTSFHLLPGDANRDRTVNLADFGILRQNFGRDDGPLFSDADFNYDGRVDLADFGLLRQRFGTRLNLLLSAPVSLSAGTVGDSRRSLFAI